MARRQLAATKLLVVAAGRSVVCQEKDRDRYGRIVEHIGGGGDWHQRSTSLHQLLADAIFSWTSRDLFQRR